MKLEESVELIVSNALLLAKINKFALGVEQVGFLRPAKVATPVTDNNPNLLICLLPDQLAFANAGLAIGKARAH